MSAAAIAILSEPSRSRWPAFRPASLALVGGWIGYQTWTFVFHGFTLYRSPDPWLNLPPGRVATAQAPVWPILAFMAAAGALAGLALLRRRGPQIGATILASLFLLILACPTASLVASLADAAFAGASWRVVPAAVVSSFAQGLAIVPATVLNPVSIAAAVVPGLLSSAIAGWLNPAPKRAAPTGDANSLDGSRWRYRGRAIGLCMAGVALAHVNWEISGAQESGVLSPTASLFVAVVFSRWFLIAATAGAGVPVARMLRRKAGWRPVATVFACAILSIWSATVLGTLEMTLRASTQQVGPLGSVVFASLGVLTGFKTGIFRLTLPAMDAGCIVFGVLAAALAAWFDRPGADRDQVESPGRVKILPKTTT